MKAKVNLLYEERGEIGKHEVVVEVRQWEGDEQLIMIMTWDVWGEWEMKYVLNGRKIVESGAVVLDAETKADAQRAGIAKFDELVAEVEEGDAV